MCIRDSYIPDLKLSEQPEAPMGKYGRMRQRYLKAVSYTHLDVYKRQVDDYQDLLRISVATAGNDHRRCV